IVERFHPCREDGGHHFVSLEINAANLARAVVHVVVAVEFGVFGRGLHHFGIGEVLLDVGTGTEQTLLLSGPQADANRATHLKTGGLENADGFEHHGRACAVVRGTGATDNGAGSAVMLEAIRILKTTGLKMRRTVRIGLWTGEEQGLLGSRAYVKQHFADPEVMKPSPEHAKLDGYYNVDNGTGKIRGVYLQGNEMVAPIFSAWMEPFHDLGMNTLTIRNTGGTDHLAFNAVGLP